MLLCESTEAKPNYREFGQACPVAESVAALK